MQRHDRRIYKSIHTTDCAVVRLSLEAAGEDQSCCSPFGCSAQEVLLCCHPSLRQESIGGRLGLVQRLETTLHVLSTANDATGQS